MQLTVEKCRKWGVRNRAYFLLSLCIAIPLYIILKYSFNIWTVINHRPTIDINANIASIPLQSHSTNAHLSQPKSQKIISNPEWNDIPTLSSQSIYPIYSREWKKQIQNTRDDIHVVFSTGCSAYQNWCSEVLLYSWALIKHPGRITRIVSGCKTEAEKKAAMITAIPNNQNRILWYFVPDYTNDEKDAKDFNKSLDRPFHYFNKPVGMKKWLEENAGHTPVQEKRRVYETTLVLIDPDMIILRPFLFHLREEAQLYAQELKLPSAEWDSLWVYRGHPVSQKYGIGNKWVNWNVCPQSRPGCAAATAAVANQHYAVGPPYVMHIEDWLSVVPKWVEFCPISLVNEPQPSMLAEMYAFSIASAYYNLRHQYLITMVSNYRSGIERPNFERLNWDFLTDRTMDIDSEKFNFHILHHCQIYWLGHNQDMSTIRLGGWMFHKARIPKDLLECDIPLLVELPINGALTIDDRNELWKTYQIMVESDDGSNDNLFLETLERRYPQWRNMDLESLYRAVMGRFPMFVSRDSDTNFNSNVWILYHLNRFINRAMINYKRTFCGADAWSTQFGLVLQQLESEPTHFRINYVLNDYEKGRRWLGG